MGIWGELLLLEIQSSTMQIIIISYLGCFNWFWHWLQRARSAAHVKHWEHPKPHKSQLQKIVFWYPPSEAHSSEHREKKYTLWSLKKSCFHHQSQIYIIPVNRFSNPWNLYKPHTSLLPCAHQRVGVCDSAAVVLKSVCEKPLCASLLPCQSERHAFVCVMKTTMMNLCSAPAPQKWSGKDDDDGGANEQARDVPRAALCRHHEWVSAPGIGLLCVTMTTRNGPSSQILTRLDAVIREMRERESRS